MATVRATSVGRKITSGATTSTLAIHAFVDQKRSVSDLSRSERIPRTIDGVPTDVISMKGEVLLSDQAPPADGLTVGYGAAILAAGEGGTIGCVGSLGGKGVLVTAGHVANAAGTEVALATPERPVIGTCRAVMATASGQELYGSDAKDPAELFAIDLAIIEPAPGVPLVGGLPGAASFDVAHDSVALAAELPNARALALGAGSRVWRRGVIVGVWPWRDGFDDTGYCVIQHQPLSTPGDSGSLWLAESGSGYVALGLHRRLFPGQNAPWAFVTDIAASSRLAGVDSLWGSRPPVPVVTTSAVNLTRAKNIYG